MNDSLHFNHQMTNKKYNLPQYTIFFYNTIRQFNDWDAGPKQNGMCACEIWEYWLKKLKSGLVLFSTYKDYSI